MALGGESAQGQRSQAKLQRAQSLCRLTAHRHAFAAWMPKYQVHSKLKKQKVTAKTLQLLHTRDSLFFTIQQAALMQPCIACKNAGTNTHFDVLHLASTAFAVCHCTIYQTEVQHVIDV